MMLNPIASPIEPPIVPEIVHFTMITHTIISPELCKSLEAPAKKWSVPYETLYLNIFIFYPSIIIFDPIYVGFSFSRSKKTLSPDNVSSTFFQNNTKLHQNQCSNLILYVFHKKPIYKKIDHPRRKFMKQRGSISISKTFCTRKLANIFGFHVKIVKMKKLVRSF